jgi:rhodanese-related sulfurtransferase
MKKITTDELIERMEQGASPVFDVRGDVAYEMGHIPGAKTAPLGSLVFRVARVMEADSFVTVYSEGGDCDLAAEAVERLENLGMTNVHCYTEGLQGWRSAGHEVVASVSAKIMAQGPVIDCRPVIVDRENAYGGAFNSKPVDGEAAGG